MPNLGLDEGLKVLVDLIKVHQSLVLSDANEADTRYRVIDSVIRKVLGWDDADVNCEERASEDGKTQFIDYRLKTASSNLLVEAKRAGASFQLANNKKSAKLDGHLSLGEVGEAIRQARDYCRKLAIPYAVVTNGSAWIVFPAVRVDGIVFEDSQARVFRSLEDVRDRFVEFWELLSYQRVVEGNLEKELLGQHENSNSRRGLSLLDDAAVRMSRNNLFSEIGDVISLALSEEALRGDTAALKFCYVQNAERIKYDSRLKVYLTDSKTAAGIQGTRIRSKKAQHFLDDRIAECTARKPRFFLITGQVGAGKSTLLRYTEEVSAAEYLDNKLIWIYIDFRLATEGDNPRLFIYRGLLDSIEADKEFALGDWDKTIKHAYAETLAALERGPLHLLKQASAEEYAKKISEAITAERDKLEPYVEKILRFAIQKNPAFIVIDNVDQIEADEDQNRIFREAHAIAGRIGANIIMSLRDSTYVTHRNSPTFDAFEFESIYVDPPSVAPVLSRRFEYAKQLLSKRAITLRLENGATLKVPDASAFFDLVGRSLLSGEGELLLEVLAGGNIRRALLLAREFLASPHVTTDRALHAITTDRQWQFPLHEIFVGAVLGTRKHYKEEDCWIPNLLCSKLLSKNSVLLRLHIVSRILYAFQGDKPEGIKVAEIVEDLHRVGLHEADVHAALSTLVSYNVFKAVGSTNLEENPGLVPTRLASYLLNVASCSVTYVEMCALDAFFYSDDAWSSLEKLTMQLKTERDITKKQELRIQRVSEFVQYLAEIDSSWVVECRRRGLGEAWCQEIVRTKLIPGLEADFQRVRDSVGRNLVKKEGYSSKNAQQ